MIDHDISETEIANFKALLAYWKNLAFDGVTPLIEKQLLLMLDHSLPFFSHLILEESFPELHRLTINRNVIGSNKRIRDIKYLKYPPANKVSRYGRCNFPKQSVFYGTFFHMTAYKELEPKKGDLLTESVWRVKDNQSLKYCPIFKNQPTDKTLNPRTLDIANLYQRSIQHYPENLRKQIDALIQFIADAFTKRITTNNDLDYIFSAYFANKIFNEFEDGTIDAIYYPSIPEKLAFENIAIKADVFDRKYFLHSVKDSVVIVDPRAGTGSYGMEGLSDCKSFDYASGKILWDPNNLHQMKERVLQHKFHFGIDLEA